MLEMCCREGLKEGAFVAKQRLCPMCSVLEPKRGITLAEKGGDNADELVALETFRILATMNPGGDFGKKVCWAASLRILRPPFSGTQCARAHTTGAVTCTPKPVYRSLGA